MNSKEKSLLIAYLQTKSIHGKTLRDYVTRISHFEKWLNTYKGKSKKNAQKKDVLNYMQYLQDDLKLTGGTRQHALGMLGRYYDFLCEAGKITVNPVAFIKLRGTRKKVLPKILSLEEMDELLDTYYQLYIKDAKQGRTDNLGRYQSSKEVYQRNHLILSFFVYQGLRTEEVTALTLDDINLQKATIRIQETSNSNARTLPLHAVQMGILYEYLNQSRPLLNSNENNMLLNTKWGFNTLTAAVKTIYPKFTKFNQIRASIITYWIQTEGLRIAQYKAGHRYVSSTEKFIAADMQSMHDDISKYHPL